MRMSRGPLGLFVAIAVSSAGCVANSGRGAGSPDPSAGLTPSTAVATATAADMATVAPSTSLEPLSADQAWAMLIPGDPASISYPSLAAIVSDADVVVIASPGKLVKGPDFTDEYGNVIYLASLTLNVERVISGTVATKAPGTLTLRTWLGVGDPGGDNYGAEFARLVASRPSGRAVFFLANMAALNKRMGGPPDHPAADPYAYQILGGQGFLRDVGGQTEPPQLSEDALNRMAGRWQLALTGRRFVEVVAEIAATNAGHSAGQRG